MKLTVLGCHSGSLRWGAFATSQVLEVAGRVFLIDCGEGTQMQLRKNKVKFSRIKQIFISHLHGDHFYGLIGLISTLQLLGREASLTLYGPKGIKEIIELQLKLSQAYIQFPLAFVELDSLSPQLVYEDDKVKVTTIPLRHRIYCNGYLFEEKLGLRRIDIDKANEAEIDFAYFNKLKQGFDVPNSKGKRIINADVTKDPFPPKKYAFCSDTAFYPKIIKQIKGVDMLYHESTFLESEQYLCERTMHSTAKQAATIALQAKVGNLILGHYSGRYPDKEEFRREAQKVFEKVLLAEDGKKFEF